MKIQHNVSPGGYLPHERMEMVHQHPKIHTLSWSQISKDLYLALECRLNYCFRTTEAINRKQKKPLY